MATLSPPAQTTVRARYLSLLQIVGTLTVIAYHVGLRGTSWGWISVELFFALAGFNMAAAVERSSPVSEYLFARVRRLAPEIVVVWILVALVTLSGAGTQGTKWFLITAPVFLQNFTEPLFKSGLNQDYFYAPLWFVGALVQLQVLLYVLRRFLIRLSPSSIVLVVLLSAVASRWMVALLLAEGGSNISMGVGDILYCLPIAHLEAIALGFLIGRGHLSALGRYLPLLLVGVLALTLANGYFSVPPQGLMSLGLEFPLRTNFAHLWGYSALALVAASLCSNENVLAVRVRALRLPPSADSVLSRIGVLTYGAYIFHGPVMASGLNFGSWFKNNDIRFAGPIVVAVTVVEAFLLAYVTRSAVVGLSRRSS